MLQLLKLPDGTVKVLVEGQRRVRITEFTREDGYFEALVAEMPDTAGPDDEIHALMRSVQNEFERYAKIRKNIPDEALAAIADATDPARLADLAAGHLGSSVDKKQAILEMTALNARLEEIYAQMQGGTFCPASGAQRSKTRVKSQMERTQREYYLNEQMKAIQKELGDGEDGQNETGGTGSQDCRDQVFQGSA